jgi:hypothetical protein
MSWNYLEPRIGDIFRIIGNQSQHKFEKNDIVMVVYLDPDGDMVCRPLGIKGQGPKIGLFVTDWYVRTLDVVPVLLHD